MKKLTILICVLAMLLGLAGVASASPPEPRKFRIEGQTTVVGFQPSPPGTCTPIVFSEGEVIRDIQGTFVMTEMLYFSEDCLDLYLYVAETGNMPLPDYNTATLIICTEEGGEVVIDFMGHTSEETVRGAFWVNTETGFDEGLAGGGTYEGIPDTCTIDPDTWQPVECTGFYVTYTGKFDTEEGKKVFDGHKKAVKELMKILDNTDAAMTAITYLLGTDEDLASAAIEEAIEAAGEDAREITKAEKEMTKAQDEIDKGKYDKAIDHYKKAWEHAQKAIKKAS